MAEAVMPAPGPRGGTGPPKVLALLPWGDAIEDVLDTLGLSLIAFCTGMTDGWLFGYAEAPLMRRMGDAASARIRAPFAPGAVGRSLDALLARPAAECSPRPVIPAPERQTA